MLVRPAVRVEQLEALKARSETLLAWCQLMVTLQAQQSGDEGSASGLAAELRAASPDPRRTLWIGWIGDIVATAGSVTVQWDDAAYVRLYVDQRWRRRGVGSAMLREICSHGAGRLITLRATTLAGSDGERFAANAGAIILLRLVMEEQRLDRRDLPAVLAAVGAHPDGSYRLVHWRSQCPPRLLQSYAHVTGFIGDAPSAALQLDATVPWDVDRVRAMERAHQRSGAELWVSAALDSSGSVVAFTQAAIWPAFGSQLDTVVSPAHRGRGLALWLKADLTLRMLRERPGVRRVSSTINEANTAMRTINRRLGYEVRGRRLLVQASVPELIRRLETRDVKT